MGRSELHQGKCRYGILHDIECIANIGELQIMPGDGGCFWHACAHGGLPPQMWTPEHGPILKRDTLEWIRQSPEQVSHILNASSDITESLTQAWSNWTSWADGRAPPLVAMHYETSIMIVNVPESCIELFSYQDRIEHIHDLWLLHFESDHFNYVEVKDYARLQKILQCFKLEPMIKHAPDLAPSLRGGASQSPSLKHPAPTAANVNSLQGACDKPGHVCSTINVGGLRTHLDRILGFLQEDSVSGVLAIQETILTKRAQHTLECRLRATSWKPLWGTPAPLRLSSTGQWRVDRRIPGLGFLVSDDIAAYPHEFQTTEARRWEMQGRLQIIRCPLPKHDDLLMINVYAPAGSCSEILKKRNSFFDSLVLELMHWHGKRVVVMGDFQCCFEETYHYVQLAVDGWRMPIHVNRDGVVRPPTYACGERTSVLDAILVSPDVSQSYVRVEVTCIDSIQHSLLRMPLDLQVLPPFQRVAYPPQLRQRLELQTATFDWQPTCNELADILRASKDVIQAGEWSPYQVIIDAAWARFESAYRSHLMAKGVRNVTSQGRELPDLQACGDPRAHERTLTPRKHPETASVLLHRAVAWIVSLARHEGVDKVQRKIREHWQLISEEFRLPVNSLDHILSDPEPHVAAWKQALQCYAHRQAKRRYNRWHAKLFLNKAHPSPTLFRWLRGVSPVATMTAQIDDHTVQGPKEFFKATRDYWTPIMRRDQEGHIKAQIYVDQCRDKLSDLPHDPELLMGVAKQLRKETAPGLDCWAMRTLDYLSLGAAKALILIFQIIECTKYWPTPWQKVRTHVIPKVDHATPDIGQHRPISVLSAWFRLWSSYRVCGFSHVVTPKLSVHLRGGIQARGPGQMLAHPMLWLEHCLNPATHDQEVPQIHALSLDASKCFDRITYPSAIDACRALALPDDLISTFASFWVGHQRQFSAGSYLDCESFSVLNGVPQGCPFSALVCNALVNCWGALVRVEGCDFSAFLDDRYILANSAERLQKGWMTSCQWERDCGWVVNPAKSSYLSYPPSETIIQSDGVNVPAVKHLVSLGVDVAVSPLQILSRQRERTAKACKTATLVSQLCLPVSTAQSLVEAVVLPQFSFHLQQRPIPQNQLRLIRASCRKACSLEGRGHSRFLIYALLRKGHRHDPEAAGIYGHIVALSEALRMRLQARDIWNLLRDCPIQRPARGPWATMVLYLERLQIEIRQGGFELHHPRWGGCEWLNAPIESLKHFLRTLVRDFHLRKAERSRPSLEGICQLDIRNTAQVYRKGTFPLRAELATILTDGVWSETRKHQAKLVPSGTCKACGLQPETAFHIWAECSAWRQWRTFPSHLFRAWTLLPRFATQCLVCPQDCPEDLRSQWGLLQKQCALILQKRNAVGVQHGWVGGGRRSSRRRGASHNIPQARPSGDQVEGPQTEGDGRGEHGIACDSEVFKRARPIEFTLVACLQSKHLPWHYSRAQWHRLTRFAAMIRRPMLQDIDRVRRPSTIELYLSYLACNGEYRFENQKDSAQGGDHVAVQLSSFLQAWRCFQHLSKAEEVVPSSSVVRDRWGDRTSWGHLCGLPNFALLSAHYLLPKWRQVGQMLRAAAYQVSMSYDGVGGGGGLWRLWAPGKHDSQLQETEGWLSPAPLISANQAPRTRLSGKQWVPTWRRQQLEYNVEALLPDVPACRATYVVLHGRSIREWLICYGVTSRRDLLAVCAIWRNSARLADRISRHNSCAMRDNMHVFASSISVRWSCDRCKQRGFLSHSSRWMTRPCNGQHWPRADEAARQLYQERCEALAILAAVKTLLA